MEGVLLSAPAAAAELGSHVEGPDGSGVGHAIVVLALQAGETEEAETDHRGGFHFADVPDGNHQLTVVRPGFQSQTIPVTTASDEEVHLHIHLALAFAEQVLVMDQELERTRFEEDGSVAVADGAALEAGTDTNLYRVVAMTPNVDAIGDRRGFSIRGIRQNGFGGGSGMLVSVRVDGAALETGPSTWFGPFQTWDLDRVEVFRGAQSTSGGVLSNWRGCYGVRFPISDGRLPGSTTGGSGAGEAGTEGRRLDCSCKRPQAPPREHRSPTRSGPYLRSSVPTSFCAGRGTAVPRRSWFSMPSTAPRGTACSPE